MAREYNEPICLSENEIFYLQEMLRGNSTTQMKRCLHGEPDLERIMKKTNLSADQLKWIWKLWHNFMGPKVKDAYRSSVFYQNIAAQSNGKLNEQVWNAFLWNGSNGVNRCGYSVQALHHCAVFEGFAKRQFVDFSRKRNVHLWSACITWNTCLLLNTIE